MSAWVLPDDVSDALPSSARHIEALRRKLQDTSASFGYELVTPPLIEYLESLLSGSGEALRLQTFKLTDQISGRSMGVRADITPQVARIDAHFLNRQGVTRLSYAGSVLHTRAEHPYATREPLQFGAEIYGHAGLEADLEVMDLALSCLRACQVQNIHLDISDIRITNALLATVEVTPPTIIRLQQALASKDLQTIQSITQDWAQTTRLAFEQLPTLYGDASVLDRAEQSLPSSPLLQAALADLRSIHNTLKLAVPDVNIGFDLSDMQGYAYYTGIRFAVYTDGFSYPLIRGGRYDAIGAAFGRERPAAGFSLDIKEIAKAVATGPMRVAICAPFAHADATANAQLHKAVAGLRSRGEVVIATLPEHENEVQAFLCDRELVYAAGHWVVQAMPISSMS